MIEIYNYYANVHLETKDFIKVIDELNSEEYKSLIWQSKLKILSMTGISLNDENIINWLGYFRLRGDNSFVYRADVFIHEGDLFYLKYKKENFLTSRSKLEVGIITQKEENAIDNLKRFSGCITKAIKKRIDGRKVRHMKLKWYAYSTNDKIESHVSFYKNFVYPDTRNDENNAIDLFLNTNNRKHLMKVAKPGFIKQTDLEKNGIDSLDTNTVLLKSGIIDELYLISCKKNSQILDKIHDLFGVNKNQQKLKCLYCDSMYREEHIQKVYLLSSLGKKMLTGSKWMTIWLTNLLIRNGIPLKSIIWSLSDSGEEVDCVVQFKNEVWIFELKDRNFEAGDAHPFNYRTIKFKANKAIIITTGKVTKDAKQVFNDLSNDYKRIFSANHPLFIEGLGTAEEMIIKLIKNTILHQVLKSCEELSNDAGMDLKPVFTKLYGKYSLEYKGKFVYN